MGTEYRKPDGAMPRAGRAPRTSAPGPGPRGLLLVVVVVVGVAAAARGGAYLEDVASSVGPVRVYDRPLNPEQFYGASCP